MIAISVQIEQLILIQESSILFEIMIAYKLKTHLLQNICFTKYFFLRFLHKACWSLRYFMKTNIIKIEYLQNKLSAKA